jgi:hypothetical protein
MIGYIIVLTLTGVITGVAMCIILGADGFFERTVAFVLGFLVHLALVWVLTISAYRVVEMLGVVL